MVAVRLTNVSKRYGRRWALVRISAELPSRKATVITGPNGAGKTTLLRVIATAMRPTRGHMEIFGARAFENLDSVRRKIGLSTHLNHLYDDLSARENLQLVARFSPGVDRRHIPEVLERVGLQDRAQSAVGHFSAGMKRRLCLARMLLRRPPLVLLDEPFSALDPEGVALVEDVIRSMRKKNVTVVMATHDVPRGLALCDLHMQMKAGRIVVPPAPIIKPDSGHAQA